MTPDRIANELYKVLQETLPDRAVSNVEVYTFLGQPYIRLTISASDKLIHNVQGQTPQKVVLTFDLQDMELRANLSKVYRRPKEGTPETFYAMIGIRIPFRKPQPKLSAVKRAVERFAMRWTETLREHKDELMYADLVDYDSLLN